MDSSVDAWVEQAGAVEIPRRGEDGDGHGVCLEETEQRAQGVFEDEGVVLAPAGRGEQDRFVGQCVLATRSKKCLNSPGYEPRNTGTAAINRSASSARRSVASSSGATSSCSRSTVEVKGVPRE
ncbi:hypothetical protein BJF85_13505 [Saccharomonospora sp. CUA-673]|nr:hypothetical protein [Saccharomonospora sp. CUA-673]OLT48237.1 hypothetical protein BJF85_13505 [Saccharomonospora sp. CUA-673]